MKLLFTKDDSGDIKVQIQVGTILEDFSYIEMVKQLLNDNQIIEPDFRNIEDDERSKIKDMLAEIGKVFSDESDNKG